MKRIPIAKVAESEQHQVLLKGRAFNIRTVGGVTFIKLYDYSGNIQVVSELNTKFKVGDVISVCGKVAKDERAQGGFEVQATEIKAIATGCDDYPFTLSKPKLNLQLNTLLDHRTLSLRHPKVAAIFQVYDLLLDGYAQAMRSMDFVEVKTPKIIEAVSEGGSNVFKIKYFDREACLAQSPQLYKQILTGVFERVFEIGSVFRAEPHYTTRHINEFIGLDAEMGMIDGVQDVMDALTKALRVTFSHIAQHGQQWLDLYGVKIPHFPESIPQIKLTDLKRVLKERYNHTVCEDTDIDPEGERLSHKFSLEEYDSDLLFVTHYDWKYRPFYTMPDPEDPAVTLSFDLFCRGTEISSGAQRIHDYNMLRENIAKKGISESGLEFYLDTFKYALPPHGGWGLGIERMVQLILGLGSVKEACLFPRDVKRLRP